MSELTKEYLDQKFVEERAFTKMYIDEALDRRFAEADEALDRRFAEERKLTDKKFCAIDEKFEEVLYAVSEGFHDLSKRIMDTKNDLREMATKKDIADVRWSLDQLWHDVKRYGQTVDHHEGEFAVLQVRCGELEQRVARLELHHREQTA